MIKMEVIVYGLSPTQIQVGGVGGDVGSCQHQGNRLAWLQLLPVPKVSNTLNRFERGQNGAQGFSIDM